MTAGLPAAGATSAAVTGITAAAALITPTFRRLDRATAAGERPDVVGIASGGTRFAHH